jgi:hypothetical protein
MQAHHVAIKHNQWFQTDTGLFTSCDWTYFYFFQTQAHTCHVANHKGTRLQSHTCHVANKYNHFFCKLTEASTYTKEPGLHFSTY